MAAKGVLPPVYANPSVILSGQLHSKPSSVGLDEFRKLVEGRSPDPLKAGQAFRNFVGNPIATGLLETDQSTVPEVVIDQPNFLPSIFLRQGYQRTLAVCRMAVERGVDYNGVNRPGGWNGTGFLVGPNLLLTNHHVINSSEVARETVCQFNYVTGPEGRVEAHVEFRLMPEQLFITSPYGDGLDYTFVAIEPAAAPKFGTIGLERAAYVVHPGTFANIVQHPDGRPQEVVLQDNEVVSDTGTLLYYLSDTDYGSSGSPVFDNTWRLIALHHARKRNDDNLKLGSESPPKYLNEGIKVSTIATDLEQRAEQEGSDGPATRVLREFRGVNSISGFFGTLGRSSTQEERTAPEIVVDLYKGTDADIDVGFWNIEWFSNRFAEKVREVATVVADFNLDIWALSESSPAAAEELVKTLSREFGLDFAVAHSEPTAGTGKQSTSVLWNKKTVEGKREAWPKEIHDWFQIDSRDFDDGLLEAIHGKVFDRYPGLFKFKAKGGARPALDFYLVPLHLKAMGEGSLRRGIATKILAAAVNRMIENGADQDWVIGGDYNAEISSGDFAPLADRDFTAISAEDENSGAITYIKGRHNSLIDHIYLSPNMARQYGSRDFFIVAADRKIPDYVSKISDHRPVMARLSLSATKRVVGNRALPKGLREALAAVSGDNHSARRQTGSVRKLAAKPTVKTTKVAKAAPKRPRKKA